VKIVPPYVRESLENLLKKNGFLLMRINKRDEFDASIDYWMNLGHLRIHIVKVPLTDQVLTYRGRSIKDRDQAEETMGIWYLNQKVKTLI